MSSNIIQHDPHEAIKINLNGNILRLGKNGKWQLESSELDLATLEIEKLVTEKEEFANALEKSLEQIEQLSKEIKEINEAKSVLLEMLMSERQQRIAMENQIEGFKEELKSSFRTIVELNNCFHLPVSHKYIRKATKISTSSTVHQVSKRTKETIENNEKPIEVNISTQGNAVEPKQNREEHLKLIGKQIVLFDRSHGTITTLLENVDQPNYFLVQIRDGRKFAVPVSSMRK